LHGSFYGLLGISVILEFLVEISLVCSQVEVPVPREVE
jgi:hypothetical protein